MKALKNGLVVLMSSVVLLSQGITPVVAATKSASTPAMQAAYTLVKTAHRSTVPNTNGSAIIYTLLFTNNTNASVDVKFEEVIPAGTHIYHLDGWICGDRDGDGNNTEAGEKCVTDTAYTVEANSSESITFVAVTSEVGKLEVIRNQAAAMLPRSVSTGTTLSCGARFVVCSNVAEVMVVQE